MGKMALGYGSEFHLLRWVGRHRNEFDKRIKEKLKIENIFWQDFQFAKSATKLDQELTGLSFLEKEENVSEVFSTWEKEWPKSGNSMNWDLVGYTENKDAIKTWLLIEAKAHIGELSQKCTAISEDSKEKIKKALENATTNFGIKTNERFYQFANRIYILDLLKRHNIKAKLINIYFIGDLRNNTRKSPQSEEDWKAPINQMKSLLNITDEKQSNIGIYDLFFDIAK